MIEELFLARRNLYQIEFQTENFFNDTHKLKSLENNLILFEKFSIKKCVHITIKPFFSNYYQNVS